MKPSNQWSRRRLLRNTTRCDSGFAGAEKARVFSRQMKTGKILSQERTAFTKPCFSEPSIGITKKRASARFYEIFRGFVKSDMSVCVQGITPQKSERICNQSNIHHTAKSVCQVMRRLRCFHYLKSGGMK